MIIGHKKQWQFLKKSAELGKLPHGILFCGQEQLGKKTLAIEWAKLLNCSSTRNSQKPCQRCRNCQDIQRGSHPDLILIEPNSEPQQTSRSAPCNSIGIKQIRDLIWKLSLRSYSAPFKIAILDQAHLMTREAQSSFLKLLEEPKGPAILILITEYPETLLPTIISRVQKLRFFPVSKAEIENYILSKGILPEKAKYFTSLSLGRPGIVINFLSDSLKLENQKKLISDLIKIAKSDLSFRFQYAKERAGGNHVSDTSTDNLQDILNIWLGYFRSIFLFRLRQSKNIDEKNACPIGPDLSGSFGENFNQYSLSRLAKIISLIQSTNFLVSTTNINRKLALEVLLMEL